MDFLQGLNPQQREAVTQVEGPILILAGAGSGKTRVITHRIAYIIRQHHVPPSAVLAVTFTNKAADEMRFRVAALLGSDDSRPPNISTFHSFCVRLLRRDGTPLAELRPGFTRNFTVYDEDDQLTVIKSAFRHLGLDEKFMQYRAALSIVSHAKNHKQTPQDFYNNSKDPRMSKLAVIFDQYEQALLRANALDFDDLLLESVRLLRQDEVTREIYNRRISYIMIDEYQDTNRSQYELMRLLSESHHNVCVVGDEDQSIYSWRGADIRNILDFERDYPEARVIRLEQNYRSTKNILDAASALVAHNKERKGKWLWTDIGAGERLGVYTAWNAENEAIFIADTIERLLSKYPEERVAVLYRTNAQSRQIEEALRRYGRKYLVVGGFSFYQRAEVKDILAYLKVAMSPNDSISLQRIVNRPARGIGRTTMDQVEAFALEQNLSLWAAINRVVDEPKLGTRAQAALSAFRDLIAELVEAAQTKSADRLVKLVLERTGYRQTLEQEGTPDAESRLENLDELVSAAVEAVERGDSLSEFLDHAALVSDADTIDENSQVILMTMHNAKGLEFPTVFIAGLEEGLLPHSRSRDSLPMLEEERRLCYVGMTRAQKRLILTWSRYRRRYGSWEEERTMPSRFLKEIPESVSYEVEKTATGAELDLFVERHEVRETTRKAAYTGKTVNSVENIAQFFRERGMAVPKPPAAKPPPPAPKAPSKRSVLGATVEHPKYGRGVVLKREGEGEDAKITVSFPGYGLRKIVERYARFKGRQ